MGGGGGGGGTGAWKSGKGRNGVEEENAKNCLATLRVEKRNEGEKKRKWRRSVRELCEGQVKNREEGEVQVQYEVSVLSLTVGSCSSLSSL